MMNKLSKSFLTLAIAASPLWAPPSACAGPLDEAKARDHLAAIAAGDLETLMRDYADDAYMEWVGGPLDGRYRGKDQIRVVWQKFIAVNEGKPRPVRLSKPQAYTNPRGASVEAKAAYDGKLPMKVWHVLTYREGELSTEVWHIAPSLQVD